MKVYLDNAATTPVHPDVVATMVPLLQNGFGNPSSIHAFGREIRSTIEQARKKIAQLINCSPGELFFTSGGTEANNMAIRCSIEQLHIKHAITSPTEHHAVLHTLEDLAHQGKIKLSLVKVDAQGNVDLNHLDELLQNNERSLVSLMHANNELGVVLPIEAVGQICKRYDALFHSDTVQTMGHYPFDMKQLQVHFINCAAHKFHGPKGVGFIYINSAIKIAPFITGGSQERNMRGGTENVYGIAGLAKALELAFADMESDTTYIRSLKDYMQSKLVETIPGIKFNGDISANSLYTVLNVSFPPADFAEMMLFNLDIKGIAASGGSACSSGSNVGSHVLGAIGVDPSRPCVRFSFSKLNTKAEIDYTIEVLKGLYKNQSATA
ncbi:MAG: cysteine desulfurase [Bacteroidia bacterium]|nr:cysteine desulfurase [Bacteroidia bacterium]HQU99810.1 cysteine desulfurase family protein [Bacteroidia bacterium]